MEGVVVGAAVDERTWSRVCEAAFETGDHVVQAHVRSVPFWFQLPEGGAGEHDVVWGAFLFGREAAGSVLRMQPGHGTGIVSAATGATIGVVIGADR